MNPRQTGPRDADAAPGPHPIEAAPGPDLPRRRLFRGAAAAGGVLLSVQARTALGAVDCRSPSAMISGNTSPRPGTGDSCSGGRSPGFWKVPQHFSAWGPAGAVYPTFKSVVVECAKGTGNLRRSDLKTPGTLLTSIGFTGAPAGVGLWEVLAFPNDFPGGQLLRHLAAAWLNAGYFDTAAQRYPVTQLQVAEMWNATKSGGLYCPTSLIGGCGDDGWDAETVIAYIEGMYDFNDEVNEPSLCTSRP